VLDRAPSVWGRAVERALALWATAPAAVGAVDDIEALLRALVEGGTAGGTDGAEAAPATGEAVTSAPSEALRSASAHSAESFDGIIAGALSDADAAAAMAELAGDASGS
jgi:hypothetical protein